MERMISVCGLVCNECEAYLATQANDEAAKEKVAAKWREQYNAPGINVAYITCDGCRAFDGRLGGHCLECEIRACGVGRGFPNCAHCSDFDACQKLSGFLGYVPQARAVLQEIRAAL